MLEIRTVRFQNHFSFGNEMTEIRFDHSPTVLVVGKNGAGKSSSILDGICFAWYGRPYRDINLGQMVNTITEKGHLVESEASVGGHHYLVRRGVKPKVFEIFKDGVLVPQPGSAAEYQQWLIDNVLRMNFKTFTQIVIQGSAEHVPFLKLKPAQRREVVEDIHDIQVYSVMLKVLKEKAATVKEAYAEVDKRLSVAQKELEVEERYQASMAADTHAQIAQKQQQIDAHQEEVRSIQLDINDIIGEMSRLLADIPDGDTIGGKVAELERCRDKITANIQKLDQELEHHLHNQECPTCGQDIPADTREKSLADIRSRRSTMQVGLDKLEPMLAEARDRLSEVQDIQDEISALETKQGELRSRKVQINRFLNELTQEIKKMGEVRRDVGNIDALRETVETIARERDTLVEDGKRIAAAASIVKAMPNQIIAQYMPLMNQLVNKYLAEFDLFVDFHLNEDFEETIRSRHRDTFSYQSFSEGEKLRIDLSILFAWRDIAQMRSAASVDLLVFDEILDRSLDDDGAEFLLEIIRRLTDDVHCVIVSHRGGSLVEKFSDVITFVKKSNFSRMERNANF